MTSSSGFAKGVALCLACGLHVAMLWGMAPGDEPVEIEGATGSTDVALGASFADMATGVMTAEETPDAAEPIEPERPQQVEPTPVEPPEPTELTAVQPPEPMQAQPLTPEVAITAPIEVTPAQDDTAVALSRSRRPKTRSADFEKEHKAKPAPQPVKKTAKKQPKKTEPKKKKTQKKKQAKKPTAQPKGNAKKNAKAGSATGNAKSKSKATKSGSGKKKSAGNASASNYPGKVMRKISRVSKPRVGSKGTAVVAFSIASNGGLAGVSIARSSGSAQLDQAAIRVIRKAAPFPPPPKGARRKFSIKIKGR